MSSALAKKVDAVGGACTPFVGKGSPLLTKPPASLESHIAAALEATVASVGASRRSRSPPAGPPFSLDAAFIGNFAGELFVHQGHLGAALVGADVEGAGKGKRSVGLRNKKVVRVEGACASGGLAVSAALSEIQSGRADLVGAFGAEVQTSVSARQGGDFLAVASHYARQRSIDDFTFPALFARRSAAYREAYGHPKDILDGVALKARGQAQLNPLAHMQTQPLDAAGCASSPIFLSNPELRPHLKVSDCSQVSDGGAGIILASEEGLRRLGMSPADAVEILECVVTTGSLYEDPQSLVDLDTTRAAATAAYAATGLSPKDMNVAEVHDCFTAAEALMVEALGFAPRGEGAAYSAASGTAGNASALSAPLSVPINTGGGLIGFGHPVGATGIKQLVEICRQMKGMAGDYQVGGDVEYGIAANMGGDDKTVVCTVLRNGQ
jgi:acetyl-CoA acyltransferase